MDMDIQLMEGSWCWDVTIGFYGTPFSPFKIEFEEIIISSLVLVNTSKDEHGATYDS